MGVSVETAQAYIDENNVVLLNQETASKDSLLVSKILKDIGNLDTQIEQLTRFNLKPVTNNALHLLDMARFKDVQTRRACPDLFIKVRTSKPKRDPMLTILITRQGGPNSPAAVYTEVLQPRELARLGFSEWEQILSIVSKQRSKAAAEVKVAIEKLMEKVRGLGLIPPEDKSKRRRSAAAGPSSQPKGPVISEYCQLLLPYGTKVINNTLPAEVEPVQHKFVPFPERGIFYFDGQNMCFQREEDLSKSPTEHLSNLRQSCMHYLALEKGFHYLISNELINRRDELRTGEYSFIKPEIESEVSKLHIFLNQQFV